MESYPIPRQRVMTDADLAELARLLKEQHTCRFDNVTREDMDFFKDLISIYKETRSEVIKWIIRGVVYGSMILIVIAAWFKLGKHS